MTLSTVKFAAVTLSKPNRRTMLTFWKVDWPQNKPSSNWNYQNHPVLELRIIITCNRYGSKNKWTRSRTFCVGKTKKLRSCVHRQEKGYGLKATPCFQKGSFLLFHRGERKPRGVLSSYSRKTFRSTCSNRKELGKVDSKFFVVKIDFRKEQTSTFSRTRSGAFSLTQQMRKLAWPASWMVHTRSQTSQAGLSSTTVIFFLSKSIIKTKTKFLKILLLYVVCCMFVFSLCATSPKATNLFMTNMVSTFNGKWKTSGSVHSIEIFFAKIFRLRSIYPWLFQSDSSEDSDFFASEVLPNFSFLSEHLAKTTNENTGCCF